MVAFCACPSSGLCRGVVRGFSVVDPGGSQLRIYKLGESELEDSAEKVEGLAQIISIVARLGDARGAVYCPVCNVNTAISGGQLYRIRKCDVPKPRFV